MTQEERHTLTFCAFDDLQKHFPQYTREELRRMRKSARTNESRRGRPRKSTPGQGRHLYDAKTDNRIREASRRLGRDMREVIYRTAVSHGWSMHEATVRLHAGAVR